MYMYSVLGILYTQLQEPSNIQRAEGERNIFIPCPFEFQSSPSIWRINDKEYTSVTLPSSPFELSLNGYIFIEVVTSCLNQTSFQCIDTSSDDLRGRESRIGVLTVTSSNSHSNTTGTLISYL